MNFRHRFKCIFTIIFIQDADTGGVVYSQNVYNVCEYMMLTTINVLKCYFQQLLL